MGAKCIRPLFYTRGTRGRDSTKTQKGKPNNMKDMMPFMMQFLGNAKANNIQFTSAETELLIQILKQNLSQAESAKADQIISLMKNRRSGF